MRVCQRLYFWSVCFVSSLRLIVLAPCLSILLVTGAYAQDSDNDGISDENDNCILVANSDQRDTNGNCFGNICDGDLTENGVIDWDDVNRTYWYLGDVGNSSEAANADINGDGVVDEAGDVELIYNMMLNSDVSGPSGTAASCSSPINQAPSIGGTPDTSVNVGVTYNFVPTASDPDGDPLTFSITNMPSWTTFNTITGELSGIPTISDVGDYLDIEINACDSALLCSNPPLVFSINVNVQAPDTDGDGVADNEDNCTLVANADQRDTNANCIGNICDGDLTENGVIDWDDVNRTYWYLGDVGNNPEAENADINGDGVVDEAGDVELIYNMMINSGIPGPSGAMASCSSQINQAPSIGGIPDTSVNVGATYSFVPTANDPDGDLLAFSITNMPNWATFNSDTGELTGTPAGNDVGDYLNIEISVCDAEPLCSIPPLTFSISVLSTPTIGCESLTIHCVDDTAGSLQEFSTIQEAIDVALQGDEVRVYGGNYSGYRVDSSGTVGQPIVIRAMESNVVIDSPVTDNGSSYGILISNASYVTVDGFTVDGTVFSPTMGIAARGATATNPMKGLAILNNSVTSATSTNIYLSQVSGSTIVGNISQNSQNSHGFYLANGGSDNTILRANESFGNFVSGIHFNGDLSVGGDGLISGVTVEANVIHHNGENGLNMDGVQSAIVRNNVIYSDGRHALRAFQIDGAAGPANLSIVNNTFVVSSANGWPIKLSQDGGEHVIFNNVLMNQGGNGSLSVESANLTTADNLVSDQFELNGASFDLLGWQGLGYGAESAIVPIAAVLFVDPLTANYQLKSGTVAIDNGRDSLQSVNAPNVDILNISRPAGNGYDIGAYENTSGGTRPPSGNKQYFIDDSGSDNTSCDSVSPCKTFAHVAAMMTGGDVLILKNGDYTLSNNGTLALIDSSGSPLPNSDLPPSGIDQLNPTVIRAENPGQVTIQGRLGIGSIARKVQYMYMDGLTFYEGGAIYNGDFITVKNSGFKGGFGIGTIDHEQGNTNNLIEDVWVWGADVRVLGINYRAHHNTWRRVLLRHDGCALDYCGEKVGNHSVGLSVYNSHDTVVENVIVVDRILGQNPYGYADFSTAQHDSARPPLPEGELLGNNQWLGSMSINSEDAGLVFEADTVTTGITATIKDFTVLSSSAGTYLDPAHRPFSGISQFDVDNVNVFPLNGDNNSFYFGCDVVQSNDPGCSVHIITNVSDGAYIGNMSNVLPQTRYGTTEPLWPWPNENRIKSDMCQTETRGLCNFYGTISEYILSF